MNIPGVKKIRLSDSLFIIITVIAAIIFLLPFYISIAYSFKTYQEISISPLAFPTSFFLGNFSKAIKVANLFRAMKNSSIDVIGSVSIMVIICSMAGYVISRNSKKPFYNFIYFMCLASILLPFQTVMFPLYKIVFKLHLINTLHGLIICTIGFSLGMYVYFYTGFVKTIPKELEESACIDGCSKYRTFWQIIFPLLKPIHITVIVISSISVWNDFMLSLIFVQKAEVRTLQLAQFYFIGQNYCDPNLAFAGFTLAMVPMVVLYLFLQKYIEKGVVAGALKG